MKIPLLLSILCAAALFSGCRTYQGGTTDETTISSGSVHETEPEVADPSIPLDPNIGPQMPPP